jgi:hypothetical protein
VRNKLDKKKDASRIIMHEDEKRCTLKDEPWRM